jgi:peptide-methionine (S)-S-oxide reductase
MSADGKETKNEGRAEIATLGGGCFWCLEPIYEELQGVKDVEVGYAGGHVANPSYEQVCSGRTGHAEVVQIHFDPDVIAFDDILRVFFTMHDPTTMNRQGADVGTQYRSIVLYHDAAQKATAEHVIQEIEAEGIWDSPVVTQIEPLDTFYRAEEYHQEYFRKNPNAGYCRAVVAPKVSKFRKKYRDRLKQTAAAAS